MSDPQKRRGRRRWMVPALAVLVLAGLTAPWILRSVRDQPAPASSPTPTPAGRPAPTPTPEPTPPREPGPFPGFWPVATASEAAAVQARVDGGAETWRSDPVAVVRAFLAEYVGWTDPVMGPVDRAGSATDGWKAGVEFRPLVGERPARIPGGVHTARLVGLPGADRPAWFVTGLESDAVVVESPRPGSVVTSPVVVSGRGIGFEAVIVTEIRDDTGRRIHPRPGRNEGFVMGGSTSVEPFEGRLAFDAPSKESGVLIMKSSTGLEGPEPAWAIVRIRFPPASVVAASPSPSASQGQPDTATADGALLCFFAARVATAFDAGRPCMTDRLAAELGSFPSGSPRVERFSIRRDLERTASRLEVAVREYQRDGAGITAAAEDVFVVVRGSDRWLVDQWRRGSPEAVGGRSTVRIFYAERNADVCLQPSSDRGWIAVAREIPSGQASARLALEELFTGPLARDGPVDTAIPRGSRVRSVRLEAGVLSVDVTRETESGGGSCSMDIRVRQIERTAGQFGTVRSVRLSVEGRTEGIFQP